MNTKILIVEDEMIIAEDMKATLKNLSYEVIGIASSGEEALEMIQDNLPNLALMDIRINGPMNGIETTKRIQSQYDIPVIFLTAYADPNTMERVKETQAYGFIVKPANRQTIQGTIELAIYKHGMDRQLLDREERLKHVNQVLRAIRNVNQLITKETDRDRLIQGACRNLVETLGYQRAWVALYDETGHFRKFVSTTPEEESHPFQNHLMKASLKTPPCVQLALEDPGFSVVASTGHVCRNCSLREKGREFCRFTMKLKFGGKVFGVMSVTVPLIYQNDEEELALFRELVEDVAFALNKFELEEARELAENEIRSLSKFPSENPNPVLRIDAKGHVLYRNDAGQIILTFMAIKSSSFLKKKWKDTIQDALKSNQIDQQEIDIAGRTYSITFTPVQEFQYVNIYGLDITERKLAEMEKEKSRRMLQTVLDTIPVRVFWKDKDSILIGGNQNFANDAGLESPEAIIGMNDSQLCWKEHAELYRKDDRNVIRSGKAKLNYEEPQTWPGGKQVWLQTSKIPLKNIQGQIIGVLGTYEDITDRKNTEIALEKEKAFTEAAINAQADTFFVFDPQTGKAMRWNKSFEHISGYTTTEIAELPAPMSYYSEEDLKRGIFFMERLAEEKEGAIELSLITKDGRSIPYEYHVTGIQDPETGKSFFVSVGRDITEQKKSEFVLKESEERYKRLSDATFEGIGIAQQGNIIDINQQIADIYGYTREEFMTKNFHDLVHPDDFEMVRSNMEKNITKPYEHRGIRKDGSVLYLEVRAETIVIGNENYRLTVIRDITKRKMAENSLRQKMNELERFNKVMVGREDRMIELKREINVLCTELGRRKKYRVPDEVE